MFVILFVVEGLKRKKNYLTKENDCNYLYSFRLTNIALKTTFFLTNYIN